MDNVGGFGEKVRGPTPKAAGKVGKGWIFVAFAMGLVIGIGIGAAGTAGNGAPEIVAQSDTPATAAAPADAAQQIAQPVAPAAQPPAPAREQITVPPDEFAFINAVKQSQTAYRNADNDLKKATVKRQRDEAVAAAVANSEFTDWIGTIRDLTTNGDGNGVVMVDIVGCTCAIGTWNNALSDFEDHSLIANGSDLYNRLSNMKQGQHVKVSGHLLNERSLTIDGSLSEPEWVARFSDISPVG